MNNNIFTKYRILFCTKLAFMSKYFLLLMVLSILFESCAENKSSNSPFNQTSFIFTDLYIRYLEESENTKITVRPMKKTIVDSLVTDHQDYLFSINNIDIPKATNISGQNWYVYEGNITLNPGFDIRVAKKSEAEKGSYSIQVPLKHFLDIKTEKSESTLLISWMGESLLPTEELVILIQSESGITHTELYNSQESTNYVMLPFSKIEKLIPGKCTIYLVRKSGSLKSNDEFGYSLNTEVYSKTAEIVL